VQKAIYPCECHRATLIAFRPVSGSPLPPGGAISCGRDDGTGLLNVGQRRGRLRYLEGGALVYEDCMTFRAFL
jgi:hypothetical protein